MSDLKYMKKAVKKVLQAYVSFDIHYFRVKKWLYVIPVSLYFENNASENEVLHCVCKYSHQTHVSSSPAGASTLVVEGCRN